MLPTPYYQDQDVTLYHDDCRDILRDLRWARQEKGRPGVITGLLVGRRNGRPRAAGLVRRRTAGKGSAVAGAAHPVRSDRPSAQGGGWSLVLRGIASAQAQPRNLAGAAEALQKAAARLEKGSAARSLLLVRGGNRVSGVGGRGGQRDR